MKERLFCSFAALTLLAAICTAGGAAPRYAVTDLIGSYSSATDINELGQVVGCDDSYHRGFLWDRGAVTYLGKLPNTFYCYVEAINDRGQIVGLCSNGFLMDDYAFLWENGAMIDLGTLRGSLTHASHAFDINNLCQVVGISWGYPFLWQDGVMMNLAPPSDPMSKYRSATGINNLSQVVGVYGFIWQDGVMTNFECNLPGARTKSHYGRAINDLGQVIGTWVNQDFADRAFLWQDGVMTDIGTLPGHKWCDANDINELGQVVGRSCMYPMIDDRAYIWEDGVMTDLNSLLPPDSGWVLSGASAINNAGQIVGFGVFNGNAHRAFLLTPIIQAAIDIKPGAFPNNINLRSKGVVTVAILTTADFDAGKVDPATVLFAGAKPVKWTLEDVDGDGDTDLLFQFRTQELNLAAGSAEATLTGAVVGGLQLIEGKDSVKIVGPGK